MTELKELEFEEQLTGGDDLSGHIGGDIYIPVEPEGLDEGTLDEPVMTTLVSLCILNIGLLEGLSSVFFFLCVSLET